MPEQPAIPIPIPCFPTGLAAGALHCCQLVSPALPVGGVQLFPEGLECWGKPKDSPALAICGSLVEGRARPGSMRSRRRPWALQVALLDGATGA